MVKVITCHLPAFCLLGGELIHWGQVSELTIIVQIMVCCLLCWPSSLTHIYGTRGRWVNTFRLRQDGRLFTDDIFKYIILNENVWIPFKISLKFISKGQINNIPALVQIMTWPCPGDKPLSEPMMLSLLMHIYFTWPQWVNAASLYWNEPLYLYSESRLSDVMTQIWALLNQILSVHALLMKELSMIIWVSLPLGSMLLC